MRTNAPKMVTVVLALGLTVVGLSLAVFHIEAVDSVVMGLVRDAGLDLTRQRAGWFALLISPLALAAGSLLKGL